MVFAHFFGLVSICFYHVLCILFHFYDLTVRGAGLLSDDRAGGDLDLRRAGLGALGLPAEATPEAHVPPLPRGPLRVTWHRG